jgi:ABC-type transport system involved in multi-copper enzyme maturation permease subunit
VRGLVGAEWLRLRKRRSLQVIVLAVPLLVGLMLVLGYSSIYEYPPFDEAAARQQLIDEGFGLGLPPEELEPLLAEAIESQRQMQDQIDGQTALTRATFAFPNSLVTALGSGVFVLLALILLTATTIGDEFGWGTLRTSLLASSGRRQFLLVRLGALVVAGLLIFGLLLLVGTILPLLLNIPRDKLPAELPAFDGGAFLVLLGGELVGSVAVIAFAAAITLLLRSGALTLVSVLVWVAVEAGILTLLLRFENFAGTYASDGSFTPGRDAWALEAFPLRGFSTLMQAAGKAASGLPNYPGDAVSRDPSIAAVPIVSLAILAVVLGALSFRRFQRMDIVE